MILGALTGILLGVLAAIVLHRVNGRMTKQVVSQAAHRAAEGLVLDCGASLPIPTNTRPVTRRNEAWAASTGAGQYRNFAYEVPTRERRYRRNPLAGADANAPVIESYTPARQMDTQSGVIVPAAQALFSGLVAALVAAVIAWRTGGDVLTWLTVGFVGGLAVSWLAALGLARSLVWRIERFTGQDLDGDGEQGEPESHTLIENPVKAREQVSQVIDDQARKASTAAMLAFWTKCVNVGTSTREHGARPGTKTLDDYEAARDLLIQLGLAQWRNPDNHRAGWDVTCDLATGARIIGEHVRTMRTRHN